MLVACVRCPLGELLTNGNVIDIFHACFRIGHYQPERSKGTTGGALMPRQPAVMAWQRLRRAGSTCNTDLTCDWSAAKVVPTRRYQLPTARMFGCGGLGGIRGCETVGHCMCQDGASALCRAADPGVAADDAGHRPHRLRPPARPAALAGATRQRRAAPPAERTPRHPGRRVAHRAAGGATAQ